MLETVQNNTYSQFASSFLSLVTSAQTISSLVTCLSLLTLLNDKPLINNLYWATSNSYYKSPALLQSLPFLPNHSFLFLALSDRALIEMCIRCQPYGLFVSSKTILRRYCFRSWYLLYTKFISLNIIQLYSPCFNFPCIIHSHYCQTSFIRFLIRN